jgi:hypothetical protein
MLRLDNKAGQTAMKRVKKNKTTVWFDSTTSALIKGSWIYRNRVILQIPPI